jgi:tetratricopeptide (TPR) repeat protein
MNRQPDVYVQDLATGLHNLGKMLSDMGHYEHALGATQEAVDLRRQLARARTESTLMSGLALSLNNLGNRLDDLGRREEAIAALDESIDIRRSLSETNPDVYLPDLAVSLNNLSGVLYELGRLESAFESSARAVQALAPLFVRYPATYHVWMVSFVRRYQKYARVTGNQVDEEIMKLLGDSSDSV